MFKEKFVSILDLQFFFLINQVSFFKYSKYDAFIALGCVIKGETPHFDFISQACSIGLMQASLETSKPVLFGVLTTENEKQAKDRASAEQQNKGKELALSALQMVELLRK